MEDKLANYRNRKEREEFIDKTKQTIKNLITLPRSNNKSKSEVRDDESKETLERLIDDTLSENSTTSEIDDKITCCTYTNALYYAVLFCIWCAVYSIFITYQFGTVYLVLSGLFGIYFNTRTKPKKLGEVSAYSVFNKNCESIDGTLKAEQFEREIRYGR